MFAIIISKKRTIPVIKCTFSGPENTYKKKRGYGSKKQDEEYNADHSPLIGTVNVTYSIEPLGKKEVTGRIDTILCPASGKTQVVTDIAITGIQQQGSFIIQDSLPQLIVSKISIAQIIINLGRFLVFFKALCYESFIKCNAFL